ncbi:ferredoxin [Streptomyces hirsutus]|uniref:ferredoxin n=1 Tax=Streptomyces hirsutus TaxID=35620 RepID=UPI0036C699E4
MRITVDISRCEAHGECVVTAPEVFDLDEEGVVVRLIDASPGEEQREKVERAVRFCPTKALTLDD